MTNDLISRQDAVRTVESFYKVNDDIRRNMAFELRQLPSAQPEYTENEEKVLIMMFTIVKNILDLQDGYMNIDDMSFGHNELFNLSEKLGIDY